MFSTDARQVTTDRGLAPLVQPDGPSTAVVITQPQPGGWHTLAMRPGANPMTAAAVLAVLRAVVDQVSRETLFYLGAETALDLTVHQLALAHRADDTGVLGDVFEYAVTAALNDGEPEVLQLTTDALAAIGERGDVLGAVIAGAEAGRARASIPLLPEGQRYATGRRGRRPLVANVLERATVQHWKNDLLIVTSAGAVGATLKSNAAHLSGHLRACAGLKYPPRLAFVPVHRHEAGIRRDRNSGVMVVRLPVDIPFLAMLQNALTAVQAAFARHLHEPASALADPGGVMGFLHERRRWTVQEVLWLLDDVARRREAPELLASAATPVSALTQTQQAGTGGALVVVAGAFTDPEEHHPHVRPTMAGSRARHAMRTFSVEEGAA